MGARVAAADRCIGPCGSWTAHIIAVDGGLLVPADRPRLGIAADGVVGNVVDADDDFARHIRQAILGRGIHDQGRDAACAALDPCERGILVIMIGMVAAGRLPGGEQRLRKMSHLVGHDTADRRPWPRRSDRRTEKCSPRRHCCLNRCRWCRSTHAPRHKSRPIRSRCPGHSCPVVTPDPPCLRHSTGSSAAAMPRRAQRPRPSRASRYA